MRRFVQAILLVTMVLLGSWPPAWLPAATPKPSCCLDPAGVPCHCPMPSRTPGSGTPCPAGTGAPVTPVAAPLRAPLAAAARDPRREPLPLPAALAAQAPPAADAAVPGLLPRPGPPPGPERLARLSTWRI